MRAIQTFILSIALTLFVGCKADQSTNANQQNQAKQNKKAPTTQTKAPIPTKEVSTKLKHHFRRSGQNNTSDPLFILLHGLGSHEGDMAKLGQNLNSGYHIISLRAPIPIGENKNSWYDYGPNADQAKANGQMDTAAKHILQTINQIKKQYKLKPSKILIGGFSQGGIMSYHAAFTYPKVFSGILPMSGRLSDHTKSLISNDKNYEQLDFHISHGTEDQRILYTDGQRAFHLLKSKGIKATFSPYKGGHNIAKECYNALNAKLGEWR